MGQSERPTCPGCGALLILALPPGGKGKRTLQCFDCDRPDPLKTEAAIGWIKGELRPPGVSDRDHRRCDRRAVPDSIPKPRNFVGNRT